MRQIVAPRDHGFISVFKFRHSAPNRAAIGLVKLLPQMLKISWQKERFARRPIKVFIFGAPCPTQKLEDRRHGIGRGSQSSGECSMCYWLWQSLIDKTDSIQKYTLCIFSVLLATGPKQAIASWGAFSAQGHWVWFWKNWVDRRFMHKYGVLNRVHNGDSITNFKNRDVAAYRHQRIQDCGGDRQVCVSWSMATIFRISNSA